MSIFIILAIVVFALLSLSSARSNARLTNKSIQQKEQYYALSSQGEEYLKQIDDALYTYYQSSSSKEEYFTKTKQLTTLVPQSTYKDHQFHFQVKNDTTTLHVTLNILYPGDNCMKYKHGLHPQIQSGKKMMVYKFYRRNDNEHSRTFTAFSRTKCI